MSSREDIKASTVSPSADPSRSALEEFPVGPQQEDKGSLPASCPAEPASEEANFANSSNDLPMEPGKEDNETPLSTKPLPKVNAVAHEVHVKATGARPGNIAGERELFSESTTTVLVFEKGGVIRLAAAVTPGQLLFLTNEETKREVVAQVMRKRTFRPTECYVELEFTEPAQGFWGMEFSAATALLPKDAMQVAAAELVASAETTADEPGEPTPPPSAEEVQALKKEIDALRSQLKLLQTQAATDQTAPVTAAPETPLPLGAVTPEVQTYAQPREATPIVASLTEPMPFESTPPASKTAAPGYEPLSAPALDFISSLPKRKRSFRARGNFTPGFRAGALRLAFLTVALLITMTGAAWYKHWLPWNHETIAVAAWPGGVTTTMAVSEAQNATAGLAKTPTGNVDAGKETPVSTNAASESTTLTGGTSEEAAVANGHANTSLASSELARQPAAAGKRALPVSIAKRPVVRPTASAQAMDSVQASPGDSVIVPPKLLRSMRATASLDDVQDFETGGVFIDAIIDTNGDVKSMNVISGPPSLRRPAMEALKNYKYQPATQNGKPIAAHVTVKIQFHFE